jgi:hypothetical protein
MEMSELIELQKIWINDFRFWNPSFPSTTIFSIEGQIRQKQREIFLSLSHSPIDPTWMTKSALFGKIFSLYPSLG